MKTLEYTLTTLLTISMMSGCDGDSCLTNPSKCLPGQTCVATSDGLWECQKIGKQGSRLQSKEPATEGCGLEEEKTTSEESQRSSQPQ